MNVRSLLAVGSLVASMVFPSLAGAQVQFRAGVQVGTPPPPVVYVQPPQPQVVVVQPQFRGRPGVQPIFMRRRRRQVVIQTPQGVYIAPRHGRRWRRHRRDD